METKNRTIERHISMQKDLHLQFLLNKFLFDTDKERNYANRQPKSYNCFHFCTYRSTLQLIPRKNLFLA